MKYKITVLDLDGTLTNSQKEITEKTKKVLDKFISNGGTVILASGRPTYGIVPVAKELGLDKKGGYIIAYNGGEIINCKTKEVIYKKELLLNYLTEIYNCARNNGVEILTYENENILCENDRNEYVIKESFINKMNIKKVQDLVKYINFSIIKLLIVGDGNILEDLEKSMQREYNGELSIMRSEPFFLEIMSKGIDKAAALRKMEKLIGFSADEVVAFGDGFNDMSMIQYAGLGVAMGNSSSKVRLIANCITKTNDEDGVAQVLEQLINY